MQNECIQNTVSLFIEMHQNIWRQHEWCFILLYIYFYISVVHSYSNLGEYLGNKYKTCTRSIESRIVLKYSLMFRETRSRTSHLIYIYFFSFRYPVKFHQMESAELFFSLPFLKCKILVMFRTVKVTELKNVKMFWKGKTKNFFKRRKQIAFSIKRIKNSFITF